MSYNFKKPLGNQTPYPGTWAVSSPIPPNPPDSRWGERATTALIDRVTVGDTLLEDSAVMCRDGVLYLVSKAGTTPDPTAATTSIAALNGQLDEPMPDFDAIELNTDDATVLSIQVDHTLSSSDITLFDACFRQCCYDLTLYLPAFQDITIVGPFQEESNPYTWSVEVPNVASTEVANEFDQQLDLWREGSPAMLTGPARPPASTPTARTRARRRSTAVKPEPKPAVDETPSAAVQSE